MKDQKTQQTQTQPYVQPQIVKQQKLAEVTEGLIPGTTTGGGAIIIG